MSTKVFKYVATAPDGSKDCTRSSPRVYSHAVMVFDPRPDQGWGVFAWVGRPELVAAQLRVATKAFGNSIRIAAVEVWIDV